MGRATLAKSPFDTRENNVLGALGRELGKRGLITKNGKFRCKKCGSRWVHGEKEKHDLGCPRRKKG
jgi:DNA-directed RNA polymerase subunit RPC12/RpoP